MNSLPDEIYILLGPDFISALAVALFRFSLKAYCLYILRNLFNAIGIKEEFWGY